MKLRFPATEDDDLDLTPMIDVVFLLVIFFMVTTTFIEEAKAFKIELPAARKPQTVSRDRTFSLSITRDGRIFLRNKAGKEEEMQDLGRVVERAKAIMAGGGVEAAILRCDAQVDYERYVQAKNALRLAGVKTVFEEVKVRR